MTKLHKQLGQCSVTALTRLLLTFVKYGFSKQEMEHCVYKCEFCQAHANSARKPIVSFPTCSVINEVVALDLSCLKNGKWFLQMICQFSRFCIAVTIPDETAKSVVSAFYKNWVALIGPLKESILTDNGREFDTDLIRNFCDKLNFNLLTTAAYSLFSNGICERNYSVLTECSNKVRSEHPELDADTVLAASAATRGN